MHQQVGAPRKLSLKGGHAPACLRLRARGALFLPLAHASCLATPLGDGKSRCAHGDKPGRPMAPRDRVAPRISPPGSGAGRARWTPIRAALALPQFTASGARALPCNCTHMPAEKLRMCCAGGETGAFFF